MTLNFQEVRDQVRRLGEGAQLRQQRVLEQRRNARQLLDYYAEDPDSLREKIRRVVRQYEPNLRCAVPVQEPLNAAYPLPALPAGLTLLAADGSQIAPDRHAEVDYCLVNVGAILMRQGLPDPPRTIFQSQLYYADQLYTETGTITDSRLGTMRDLSEREMLVKLAQGAEPPVVSFTDGPLELWGGTDGEAGSFKESLEAYLGVLAQLNELGVTTAGYVDKPASNLVLRTLEVMITPEAQLPELRKTHPLREATDRDLFRSILKPGERSAVFALQSYGARSYTGPLALHFFYLNTGREGHPWLARVEIPAWVAGAGERLDQLHAVLVGQCRLLGSRPYPYLLHRAHEAAVVTLEEKEQVTQMIAIELRRRGVSVDERSYKQAAKDLAGRTSYGG